MFAEIGIIAAIVDDREPRGRAVKGAATNILRVASVRVLAQNILPAALVLLAALMLPAALASTASAQLQTDTLFTWRGYSHESVCRIRVYHAAQDEKKPFVVVLDELAENHGRSTLDDSRHLAELVSRAVGIDPEAAYWIFHWGDFSHRGAEASGKELFLRATFRRSDSGAVGPPFWRLINRETVTEYTDRAFR